MKKSLLTDKELTQLFKNDNLNCKPDPKINSRLSYTFFVKSRKFEVYQNSFAGYLGWLFSLKYIPLKAAMVSVILLFSLFNFQQKSGNYITPSSDSTMFIVPFSPDSATVSPLGKDTCYYSKT